MGRETNRTRKSKRKRRSAEEEGNQDDQEDEYAERLEQKISTLSKLIKQCKFISFKQRVMKECQEVFRNDNFFDKLNANLHLVAFKNGVYDFKNDCFRDGKPEDFLLECVQGLWKHRSPGRDGSGCLRS